MLSKIHKFLISDKMDSIMLCIVIGGCLLPFFLG
jgi:hypothetical protein